MLTRLLLQAAIERTEHLVDGQHQGVRVYHRVIPGGDEVGDPESIVCRVDLRAMDFRRSLRSAGMTVTQTGTPIVCRADLRAMDFRRSLRSAGMTVAQAHV